jgi:hypothetical protein
MNAVKLYKPWWWVLHVGTIAFFFWLGHFVRF